MQRLFNNKLAIALVSALTMFMPMSYAQDNSGTIHVDCTLSDSMSSTFQPGEPRETFTQDDKTIYIVCLSDQLKQGDKVEFELIAVDINNVVPNNTKLTDHAIDITPEVANKAKELNMPISVHFSLDRPANGWAPGKYRVELYVNGGEDGISTTYTIK